MRPGKRLGALKRRVKAITEGGIRFGQRSGSERGIPVEKASSQESDTVQFGEQETRGLRHRTHRVIGMLLLI